MREPQVPAASVSRERGNSFMMCLSAAISAKVAVPKMAQYFASFLLVWNGLVQMCFWSLYMYRGRRLMGPNGSLFWISEVLMVGLTAFTSTTLREASPDGGEVD